VTTQLDLCNRALAMAGTRSQITDLVSSPEGLYCGLLYDEFRDFMLREGDYDFAMSEVALVPGSAANGWAFGYEYPPNCIRVRQVLPAVLTPFDPQPMQWNASVGNVILTILPAYSAIITTNAVPEDNWDALFTDAFVRLLASGLFMALENRIEAHKMSIEEALQFAAQANVRDP
jgi:hypothetical protein